MSVVVPPRYIVLGAGGVGCALGGMLQLAGALVARGAHLDALRRKGLSLATPSRSWILPVTTAESPRELDFEARDVMLLCTKSQDSAAALADLAASAPRETPIVCAQNGVANEPLAAARFDRILGLMVFSPIGFTDPGRVTIHSEPVLGALDVGSYPIGADALVSEIVSDLSRAGFDARVEPRIMRLKYGKLLTNLANALQALAGPAGLDPALLARMEAEAIACFQAAGIEFASLAEVVRRGAAVGDLPVEGSRRGGGSTWQSLLRGTGTIETDYLNGEIVRLGEQHGVPTPLNRALTSLAARAAVEGWKPGSLSGAELAAALEA
ncbi:MAG: 2-dehydropantoate 2-reductase N-terminal domain-containing protein [Byssovorax sp.]